ncbi:SUMF1/EgtB/PvdO family nonheme iron enzyme [Cardinium endosymbiont of Dermatophagoides farinae]|uniref:SUMF1/EgtB/PvdO family nonheme iron enzyme n=1 Tax=Cardinium endosymbiont of Dermatophagoides farinae TaxID=2597823 RepID=UPI0016425AA4|nr:SUMF1/EgtB/PvdO family nonheme iron enzyme [Cardinium endosymbiont of Dermatophagoides farinae]
MIFRISRLGYFLFVLVYATAYGKSHPTSARPGKVSLTTGRRFNQPDTLPVVPHKQGPPIPGMIYVEGGYMTMGNLVEDKLGTGGGSTKPVTITSFYIDQTPITNLDYREYLYDLQKNSLTEAYKAAMPNQQALLEGFSYNNLYLENYLNAPGFAYYPVVGVSWEQATEYCKWRTKKFQEEEIKKYKAKLTPQPDAEEGQTTAINNEDIEAIISRCPEFRLASEAEWEYAAHAIIGTANIDYLQRHQRIYPWDGSSPRGKNGQFLANFKRGKGNYKGMAGESDHAAPTSYVYAYPPNDLGLYDMVGNVCCWVSDTYSPLALQDSGDLNPVIRDGSPDQADHHKGSLTNAHDKVYKGCSWADSAYFLQIGTRRYLNKDSATATIGFRCVVSSLGR